MKARTFTQLLLAFFLFLSACTKANGPNQKMPRDVFDYLEDQAQSISVESPINLATLTSAMDSHRFIMTGETHGIAANYELEFMLLKHLVEANWLDYYVPELPPSFCYFLSQYLENGEEIILTRLFEPLEGTFSWTNEAKQHWRKVRSFYQSLPPDQRFSLIGIEIEHQARNTQWMLLDLLPDQTVPAFLQNKVEVLTNLVDTNNDNYLVFYSLAQDLNALLQNQAAAMQEYLGESFEDFQEVVELAMATYEARNDDVFSSKREAIIFENFLRQEPLFANGNSYGQWGANHIYRQYIDNVSWLAAKINQDPASPLQGAFYSILYLYHDCKALLKNPYREANYSNLLFVKDFKKMAQQDYTLFRLDEGNSPFAADLIWPSNSVSLTEGVTTDYVQSILLVRDSPAATTLN